MAFPARAFPAFATEFIALMHRRSRTAGYPVRRDFSRTRQVSLFFDDVATDINIREFCPDDFMLGDQ